MKNIFTMIVLALMLMAIPVKAQWQMGVTAGLNITTMSFGNGIPESVTGEIKNKAGFLAGVTAVYHLADSRLSFDLSACYDQRSAKTSTGPTQTFTTRSLLLPINVRYRFFDYLGVANVFAFAGPQLGLQISKKNQSLYTATNSAGDAMELQWSSGSSLGMGMNLGVGVMVLDKVQARISYNLLFGKSGQFERVNHTQGTIRPYADGKANACQVAITYFL